MKKITHTVRQQARRQRALARFSVSNPNKFEGDDLTKYVARKEQERAALVARVSI